MEKKSTSNFQNWKMQATCCLFIYLCLGITSAIAQQAGTYTYSTFTGQALDAMTGATQILGKQEDNTPSSNVNIGFNFSFEGTIYTTFSVTPDGFVKLGAVTTGQANNVMTNINNIPKLCPWWDDSHTGGALSAGEVTTVLTGSSPNRIRVIQFFTTVPKASGITAFANATYQVWLYEITNVIEFRYGSSTNGTSATVGIRGAIATPASFISITTSSHTASTVTANDANSVWPGSGRMYRFTPPFIPCSGIPNPGATVTSNSTICTGTPFTLSLANIVVGSNVIYQWQSGPSATGPWTTFGANAPAIATTLTVTTWYQCNVTCTGNTVTSTPVQVTAANCCNYTFRLRDDFGDGWNGALMQVRIGTTVIATLGSTFTNGTVFDETLQLMSGTTYNLFYLNDGSFPAEVGVRVFDPNAVAIHNTAFGSGTVGTTLFTFAAACPLPCTGTPAPGTTLTDLTAACPTDVFTLSLSTNFLVTGITYQWQNSPNGTTWTNIGGATLETYSGSQTVATYYRCRVTCNGSATGNSTARFIGTTLCYCESAATNAPDDEIFNVTLNTLNNTTVCNSIGPGAGSVRKRYGNYTTLTPTNLTQGITYSINLTLGYCDGTAYETSAAVFIDFNQNGIFDASERVYNSPYQEFAVGGSVVSGTVEVPGCAVPGVTRLRVVMTEFETAPAACGTYTWGETEDYFVNIVAAPIVPPVASTISGPPSGTCNTSLSYTIASGYSGIIQWQTASAAAGPYTDIPGATLANQPITPPSPGTYFLRAAFTGQGCVTDVYSNILTVTISAPVISVTANTPNSVCRGTAVQLTASGSGPFFWSTGGTTATITSTPLFTNAYTVTSGTGTCQGTGSKTITVIGGPIAGATVTPAGLRCPGTTRTLHANLVNGASTSTTFGGGGITIPLNAPSLTSGTSNPYPSNLSVSGLAGTQTVANVKINGFTHSYPEDVDIVLVAPDGSKVILLADNGNGNSVTGINLTLQDGSANLPGTLSTGTFRTSTNTGWSGSGLAAPYFSTLSSFTGSFNGTWKLYVYDDAGGDYGSIDSWSITFTSAVATFNYDGPVTYSWSAVGGYTSNAVNPVINPLTNTTYTLTVADNSCSSSSQVTVQVRPAPTVTTYTGTPFCENSSVDFFTDGSGATSTGTAPGTLTVNISGPAFLDELSWNIMNSSNVIIASGGNYANGSTNTIAVNPSASDYPVTFNIETQGAFGDNEANYSVVCSFGTSTLAGGTILGGDTFSSGPLNCGSPLGTILYSWTGPNSFSSTLEDPSIPSAALANSGDYTVTITDGNGCNASFTTTVVINDNPELYTASTNNVSCDGFADGSFQIGVNGGSPYFSFFETTLGQSFSGIFTGVPAGTYYLEVSDINQCVSQMPLEVIIETVPNVAPVISCPASLSVTNNVGVCGAVVNYSAPVGTDACPGASTVQIAGLASGSVFPIGTTTNTFAVTDAESVTTSCSFTVTVTDNIAPTFPTAAANMIVECDGNGNTAALNGWLTGHGGAVASDECGGLVWADNYTGLSNLCGVTGSATVTFQVTDANNNISTTSATFIIEDTQAPAITPASSSTVECDGAGNTAALNAWLGNHGGATASDICSGVTWSNNYTPITPQCGSTGSTIVTFTATDACNNASSTTATFTIEDNTAPALSCPANITVNNTPNQCGANVNFAATASDICSGTAAIGYSIAPGSFFNIGTTTVNTTATDACGNDNNCSFTVTVLDAQSPVIICPSNIISPVDPGVCGAMKTYALSFNDNCAGTTINQTAGLPSGATFPVGTTVNTFVVTDASGNTNTCSFNVSITDNLAPIITSCPANFSSCNPITWTPPTISDNCPGVVISSTNVPGSNFGPGTTTVTYTATDAYNNVSTCSFQVTRYEQSVDATSITSDRDFNNICSGDNINLTINGGTLGQGGVWKWYTGSCAGTPLPAFTGMTTINVSPIVTTTYFARAEGTCNNTACVSITVVVSTTGPPNGSLAILTMPPYGAPGVTGTIDVTPVPGATFYRWSSINGHINAVWFPTGPGPVDTNVPSVNVLFNQSLSNYQIRVVAGNACGRTNNVSAHIRGTVPASTCLNGPVLACPNTTATYSVASCPIPGTNTYQWAVTGNATITAGQGTPTITVSFGAGFTTGTVCVNGITNFGLAGPQTCLTVSNNTATPGVITGNNQPCQSGSETYTIAPVAGATSYLWITNIVGATASGTTTTGSVQFPSGSFSGNVCVQAISSCGTSLSSCFSVSSGAAGNPGPILGPQSGICGAVGNYALSTNDANSYNWILPAGVTFASPNGSNSVQLQFPAAPGSFVITVEAFYSCGSATSTITVNGAPGTPTVTPATICAGGTDETYIASAAGADSYTWTTSGAIYEQCTNPNCSNYYIIWDIPGGSFSVTAVNNCGVSAVPFSLSTNCRISESGQMETKVYPNPTTGQLTIEFTSYSGGNYNMSLTDMSGRTILTEEVKASSGNNQHQLNLEQANPGMYMLYIKDSNGQISVTKITKE